MKILEKCGDEMHLLSRRPLDISVGDFLLIWDDLGSALLVQVVEETYLNVESSLMDAIREEVLKEDVQVDEEVSSFTPLSNIVRDLVMLRCKIRGSMKSG
ncbi:MAG: hypothetical protein QXG63_00520, partial [Nitrososphaerales archaeon]